MENRLRTESNQWETEWEGEGYQERVGGMGKLIQGGLPEGMVKSWGGQVGATEDPS